jgi:glycosyltransferase involved in cell wall biosynthesis
MGGGIGSVLFNWIKSDEQNDHEVLCLSYNYYNHFDPAIVKENMRSRYLEVAERVIKSDIVVVHFWNHPYLFEWFVKADIPDCRMCIWSHVSGLSAPYVFSEKLVDFSDAFLFASPISFKTPEIKTLPKRLMNKTNYIWTTGNIDEYMLIKPVPHDGFNIGFVGTLDYSKLHPNFIDMCSRIEIPDVKFIMIGGGCDAERIKQEVEARGLDSKFFFVGIIEDIKPYLAIIDIFGYPLNPDHFGTCEQVLGEAIAAGVIPIVMKNPAEEYILFRMLSDFVCRDEAEYVRSIERFYHERERYSDFIDSMRQEIAKLYDSDKMVNDWYTVFDHVMKRPKRKRVWTISDERASLGGYGIFLESLGPYGNIIERGDHDEIERLFNSNLQWRSLSKGSPIQYLEAFPYDPRLQKLVDLVRKQ